MKDEKIHVKINKASFQRYANLVGSEQLVEPLTSEMYKLNYPSYSDGHYILKSDCTVIEKADTPEPPKGDSAEAQEIKPCPFCGAQPIFQLIGKNTLRLRCSKCFIGNTQKWIRFDENWLRVKMTERWNARIPDVACHRQQLEKVGEGLVRYGLHPDGFEPIEDKDGDYVLYDDACAKMAKERERVRGLEEKLSVYEANAIHSCHPECQMPICKLRRELEEARASMFTREQVAEICREQWGLCCDAIIPLTHLVVNTTGAMTALWDYMKDAPLPEKVREKNHRNR
jgi:hypothetical protein